MKVEPIKHTDLSYLAYKQIREMIISGALKPGEKLLQEQIASMLGVSRMPLHKAFARLEDEFLVESIPRRGIFIRKPDIKEIMEAFQCREGLEGIAARRAAEILTEEEIDEMRFLFEPFLGVEVPDELEYQQADQEFHERIIRASGNSLLLKLNNIGNFLIRTYPRGIILPVEESLRDHREIIRAFEQRDGATAEMLIRTHSRKAYRILEKLSLKEENHTNE